MRRFESYLLRHVVYFFWLMKSEIWKPVRIFKNNRFYDFSAIYMVSNYGNVKNSMTGRLLKHEINGSGYCIVRLVCKINGYWKGCRFRVHRLVGTAFLSNPDKLPQINHLDGNKENNFVANLKWCTSSENCRHAYENHLISKEHLDKCRMLSIQVCSKKVCQFSLNDVFIRCYDSACLAAKAVGLKDSTGISRCCNGKRYMAGGYKWKFYEE